MDTMSSSAQFTSRGSGRRRLGLLLGLVGVLLLVPLCRYVTNDRVAFYSVGQRSCQGSFCVERVHSPDLLFVPGSRDIQVRHKAISGRVYREQDPFDDRSQVKIEWNPDGGVTVSDETGTVTWTGDRLARLSD